MHRHHHHPSLIHKEFKVFSFYLLAPKRHLKISSCIESQTSNPANSPSSPSSYSSNQSDLIPRKPKFLNKFKRNETSEFSSIVSCNKRISSYIRSMDLDSALRVFESMAVRTTVTWNSILAGFSRKPGKFQEACEMFDKIPEPDVVSYNIMLVCYLNNAGIGAARSFFEKMPVKDVASWNTMISGFSQNGMMNEANELFMTMPVRNEVTWNAMISGYVESGELEPALEIFNKTPEKGVIARTAIITGYMRCGNIELAEKMFQEMPEKNLVTWNAVIAGYVENGRGEDGLKLFRKMVELGIKANPSTLSSVLLGCSNLSAFRFGMQVHQRVCKLPICLDMTVGTSLISMYCKCGILEDARKLFLDMPRKDVVSWNAMVSGYAQHGKGDKALRLFDEMRHTGIQPDCISFVGVLSACNHAGLVDLGIHYFEKMQNDYGIKPKPDHVTCMVDLLARAGRLDEAVDLISNTDFKPHPAFFGTLLGACRIHKNVEVAEFAAKNLHDLDPSNAAGYVQLANVYAAKNRWNNVSRVRKLMKQNQVVKTPGYSWMEVKGVVHEFRSGDRLHPELEAIHSKLKELEKKMKSAGYVPDLESSLHDVGEEQKEQMLLWHSEKLAIAFGLLRIPVGVPIRIFKNLRVCGDCHKATKFISAIEDREIVVRDTTRFHHFKNGSCSCCDYW
nr:pentatricopeptide repeat-containing protein At4g16835, mitochondrial [Ipomoea trifida]